MLHVPGQIKVVHLSSELRGEAAGVEQRDRAYPAPSFHLAFEEILHAMAQGGDHAHTGNYNSSSHARLESLTTVVGPEGGETGPPLVTSPLCEAPPLPTIPSRYTPS